jgi:hypothetical protein
MLKTLFAAIMTLAAVSLVPATASAGNQLAVAIGGYDTVSYHDGAPTAGEARINHF